MATVSTRNSIDEGITHLFFNACQRVRGTFRRWIRRAVLLGSNNGGLGLGDAGLLVCNGPCRERRSKTKRRCGGLRSVFHLLFFLCL
jgi:hypothetical protein